MPEFFPAPLIKRPSTHLDDVIQNHYVVDFIPPLTGKEVVTDNEIVGNLLHYLTKLDLEKPENLTSVNDLRGELDETEKAEEAAKAKAKTTEESSEEPSEEGEELQDLDILG